MSQDSKNSLSYWLYSLAYVFFIYLFSVFFLKEYILNSCNLSIIGNDWINYLHTADVISGRDLASAIAAVQARFGNVDPGYWFSTYLLTKFVEPESYTPILNSFVIALAFFLAKPLINFFELLIFTIFATTSYSFFQNIILLPRQFCSYFIFELAIYCFFVSDRKKIHPNVFFMLALAFSFHWSVLFAPLFWLVPILKSFLANFRLRFSISSAFLISITTILIYSMIRLNILYKITTYLIENTENELNTGQLSFFLPFLLIVLVKFFAFSNFSIKYGAKLHQIKSMINWALISSFLLYIFFISTQSLGISRITLSLYSIAIPMIAFAFLGSSPNKRQLILTAYLFLFVTIEIFRISKVIDYIIC
tara:strand:+ start:12409 stop:13500 length:1092 start_codon:yes stop_codon:yes gene_type:complete